MAILLIKIYQRALRPIFDSILKSVFGFVYTCPQQPSCSEYTIFQIQRHGTIVGLKKGLIRFWHCR